MNFLGYEIDSMAMEVRLPNYKSAETTYKHVANDQSSHWETYSRYLEP